MKEDYEANKEALHRIGSLLGQDDINITEDEKGMKLIYTSSSLHATLILNKDCTKDATYESYGNIKENESKFVIAMLLAGCIVPTARFKLTVTDDL